MTYTRRPQRVRLRSTARLERAMKSRDINAAELAALAKTTRQTISNLRKGTQSSTRISTAKAIADALRVDPVDLFELTDSDRDKVA